MLGSTSLIKKFAGRLNNVISSGIAPLDFGGVKFVGNSDGFTIDI
jgi:hypothetical protein